MFDTVDSGISSASSEDILSYVSAAQGPYSNCPDMQVGDYRCPMLSDRTTTALVWGGVSAGWWLGPNYMLGCWGIVMTDLAILTVQRLRQNQR
jgi:hypothetical protein